MHARIEPGKFSTTRSHIASAKTSSIERGTAYLLGKVQLIGPSSSAWAVALVSARGIESGRVLQGLLALTRRHEAAAIKQAYEAALRQQSYRS